MSLRLLLIISGGLEALVGVLALLSPAMVVSLLIGAPVDQLASVLVRLFGAGVFSLGLACLQARDDAGSAGRAVRPGDDAVLDRVPGGAVGRRRARDPDQDLRRPGAGLLGSGGR